MNHHVNDCSTWTTTRNEILREELENMKRDIDTLMTAINIHECRFVSGAELCDMQLTGGLKLTRSPSANDLVSAASFFRICSTIVSSSYDVADGQ